MRTCSNTSIIESLNQLISVNKLIKFCWTPSHVGIKGNEKADAAAKAALALAIDNNIKISYSDMKTKIAAVCKHKFQSHWDNVTFNKLKSVKGTVGKTVLEEVTLRRDEIVLHRVSIGHSNLTHCYLLKRENAPECVHYQCLLTVEHILVNCPFYNNIRTKYYTVMNLKELFS